jgi:hypothetical protein
MQKSNLHQKENLKHFFNIWERDISSAMATRSAAVGMGLK